MPGREADSGLQRRAPATEASSLPPHARATRSHACLGDSHAATLSCLAFQPGDSGQPTEKLEEKNSKPPSPQFRPLHCECFERVGKAAEKQGPRKGLGTPVVGAGSMARGPRRGRGDSALGLGSWPATLVSGEPCGVVGKDRAPFRNFILIL